MSGRIISVDGRLDNNNHKTAFGHYSFVLIYELYGNAGRGKMRLLITALVAAFLLSACKTTEQQINEVISLDKEHFKRTVSVKDDSLETVAILSTVEGFKHKKGLLGIVWDDNFLRASIDKKTGATSFYVYNTLYYRGSGWHHYSTVNYETLDGVKTARLDRIGTDVDCSGSRYQGCTYNEHVGFTIDREILETVAALYKPGEKKALKYRLKGRTTEDYTDALLPAEIAGLLEAVDEYSRVKGYNKLRGSKPKRESVPKQDSVTGGGNGSEKTGRYTYQAQQASKAAGCNSKGWPKLLTQTGANELYQLQCREGGRVTVECEWGKCRVLR